MPATKAYTRVNFENYPSTNTPLNATNLNKVDKGIDDLDDLLVTARNNIETLQSNATTDEANILALQGSVAALNGFTFYPAGEVDLVALVAGDSFYKDANDKYVLADSTTGQALIDGVTYKALASTEDTRGEVGADSASPFSGGDIKAVSVHTSTGGNSASLTINSASEIVFISTTSCIHADSGTSINGAYISINGTYETISDNAQTVLNPSDSGGSSRLASHCMVVKKAKDATLTIKGSTGGKYNAFRTILKTIELGF